MFMLLDVGSSTSAGMPIFKEPITDNGKIYTILMYIQLL